MTLEHIFRENVKFYRKQLNLSQEKLAELSDLTQQYICSIENARVNPSFITLVKITEALNVTFNDLVY